MISLINIEDPCAQSIVIQMMLSETNPKVQKTLKNAEQIKANQQKLKMAWTKLEQKEVQKVNDWQNTLKELKTNDSQKQMKEQIDKIAAYSNNLQIV